MISLTEEKCAATTKEILEMTEVEKTEKEMVTGLIHVFISAVQHRHLSALKRISPVNTLIWNPFLLDFATEESDGRRNKTDQEIKWENHCASRGNGTNRKQGQLCHFPWYCCFDFFLCLIVIPVATVITKHHKELHAHVCFPQRLQGEAEVSCTEERLSSRRTALAALCENNMECQTSAEEYRAKLSRRYYSVIERLTLLRGQHSECTALPCLSVCFPLQAKQQWGRCARRRSTCSRKSSAMTSGRKRPRRKWPALEPDTEPRRLSWESRRSSPRRRNTGSGSVTAHVARTNPLLFFSFSSFSVSAAQQAQLEKLRRDLRSQTEALEPLEVTVPGALQRELSGVWLRVLLPLMVCGVELWRFFLSANDNVRFVSFYLCVFS